MAITPADRSASLSCSSLLRAPRSLNAAVNCRFSNFTNTWQPSSSDSVWEWALGVRSTAPLMRASAAITSSQVTGRAAAVGAGAGAAGAGVVGGSSITRMP
jgi:hypothetical protein